MLAVPSLRSSFMSADTSDAAAGFANWNWGGREHPKYQTLSMATKSLLGMGKLIARMVLLKPRGDTDDCERALVGNTILVAQPSPEMIATELPPSATEQAQYFNVIYAAGPAEHGPSNLRKQNESPVR